MFSRAVVFDAAGSDIQISKWDMSNVSNMRFMFSGANAFNRNITGWNTGSCANMTNMFAGNNGIAMQFNQAIGAWDTSSVTNLNNIFTLCNSFDQDLSNWNLNSIATWSNITPALTQAVGSFGLSTANYDALLVAWDAYAYPNLPANSTWNFGSSQYTLGSAAETARTSLINKWGGIIDGGGV
tara:strand:- start:179 stop:727 length:549 start_codon:yes stop_codon:yes gene_type:complete